MTNYQILYRIVVEHDYFNGGVCSALQLCLAPQSTLLAMRRALLFRQMSVNSWVVLYDSLDPEPASEDDVLILGMNIVDPAFAFYTEWENFRPKDAYVLQLPTDEESVNATSVISPLNEERKVGNIFCTVALRLTKDLQESAKAGKPKQTVLHFHSPTMRWEYLFIPRSEVDVSLSDLSLEDAVGKLEFSAFEECEVYGQTAWRTISKELIPMRMAYASQLRLVEQNFRRYHKRVLLPLVSPPEPGRFLAEQNGVIRQICYC